MSGRSATRRLVRVGAVGVVLAGLFAGCGGDGDGVSEVSASSGVSATTGPAPTGVATTSPGSVPPAGSTSDAAVPAGPCAEGTPAAGALALTGGAVGWTACSPAVAWRTVLGGDDGVALVASITEAARRQDTTVTAHSVDSGATVWTSMLGDGARVIVAQPGGPVLAAGVAVFGWGGVPTADASVAPAGKVVALDAKSGAPRWEAALTGAGLEAESLVALTETTVVVGSVVGMRGLDRRTGTPTWTITATNRGESFWGGGGGEAVAVEGELVVLTSPSGLMALDAASGAVRWRGSAGRQQIGGLAIGDGVVIAGMSNGPMPEVVALDATTGAERWRKPGAPAHGNFWAVGDGIVVARDLSGGAVVAYELADGGVRWRVALSATFVAQPQLVQGKDVVVLWESQIGVLATADGATRWLAEQPFGSPLMNSVAAVGDRLVVAVNSRAWGG